MDPGVTTSSMRRMGFSPIDKYTIPTNYSLTNGRNIKMYLDHETGPSMQLVSTTDLQETIQISVLAASVRHTDEPESNPFSISDSQAFLLICF